MRNQSFPSPLVRTAALCAVFGILAIGIGSAADGYRHGHSPSKSVRYSESLTLVADGEWNLSIPPSTGQQNCDFIFCDGTYFHEQVMGFGAAQIADLEMEAKEYFKEEFGIDVDDPNNQGRVDFRMFEIDPRWHYRVRAWSGHWVPKEGFEVRDGGFLAMVIDEDGFDLGGSFAGVHLNPGDLVLRGHYNIKYKHHPRGRWQERVIAYRSNTPMIADARFGLLTIDCQLSRDGFHRDRGAAQGLGGPLAPTAEGVLKMNGKNVLLFPKGPKKRHY